LEQGQITNQQMIILIALYTVGSSILIVPAGLAVDAKQDAWLAAILGVGVGLLIVWMYGALANRFNPMTLIEFNELLFGKWLGKTAVFLLITFCFLLGALVLRNIGDFMVTQIMPKTPIQAVHIVFAMIVVMGARLGVETLARSAEILFPWVILLFFISVLFLLPQIHPENIQPVLEQGIKPIIKATIPFVGTPFLELVVFLMITPYLKQSQGIKKTFFLGVLFGGGILILVVTLTILALGPGVTARNVYPTYVLVKKINIGHFLERIEAFMAGIWFMTIFFKTTICFYVSALGISQILKLKDYRILTFPLGVLLLVLSIISYPNMAYMIQFVSKIWFFYSFTYGCLLPLLLLLVAYVNKRF
jgi:spore germination protein KB